MTVLLPHKVRGRAAEEARGDRGEEDGGGARGEVGCTFRGEKEFVGCILPSWVLASQAGKKASGMRVPFCSAVSWALAFRPLQRPGRAPDAPRVQRPFRKALRASERAALRAAKKCWPETDI